MDDILIKYNIAKVHKNWDVHIDDHFAIEIFRIMHNGNLPTENDVSYKWITDFLDKKKDMQWWCKNVMTRPDCGNIATTSKRLVYRFLDEIIKENNER